MPSNKPIIAVRTTQDIIEKMRIISEENGRSISKETELLVKEHIKKYESLNGEIKLDE